MSDVGAALPPGARPQRAVVVGTTAWGCTLALVLARNGVPTTVLAREASEAQAIADRRASPRLPGITFPDALAVTADRARVTGADLVCFATPAQTLAANVAALTEALPADAVLLSAAKGLELQSGRRMTEVLAASAPGRSLAAISGPNLSREVAAGLPGTTVIAAQRLEIAEWLRGAFHGPRFRVYTSDDVVGVEFGGALKNIIAIAAGIVDALGFGDNAKAAFVTRGLAEMTRLGVAAGADPLTFQGLAGIGDLVASSYSQLARNRRVGEWIGGGMSVEAALERLGETAEGVATTPAALRLSERLGVELPIVRELAAILEGRTSPEDAVASLLGRDPTSELAPSLREHAQGG